MTARSQAEVIDSAMAAARRVMRGSENRAARNVIEIYRQAQDEIQAKVMLAFQRAGLETWDLATMKIGQQDLALYASINQQLSLMSSQVTAQVEEGLVSQFIQSVLRSVYAIDQVTPGMIAPTIPLLPRNAIAALVNTPYMGAMYSQRIGAITDIMAGEIQSALITSMLRGDSMEAAANAVAEVIGAGNLADPSSFAARAQMIARTEIMRAQNMGYEETYARNSDVLDGFEWLVTPDDRLCEECLALDGKSSEELSGVTPPLHPNCRCVIVPRLKPWDELGLAGMPEGTPGAERGMRDPISGEWYVTGTDSYNKWAAQAGVQ